MTNSRGCDTMRALRTERECPQVENKDYVKAYQAKMDAFKIRPSKDEGQTIREYAAAHEMSVQGLFLEAVREYMTRHQEDTTT